MLRARALLLIATLALLTGCPTYSKIVQVGPGRAYVVSRENQSQTLLSCQVINDEPKCWKAEMKEID